MTDRASDLHPFERCGFGVAPFRLVGISENLFQMPDGTCKPGGACDYCGNGIRWEFQIKSSDGKTFKIGCDCAATQLSKRSNKADKKLHDQIKKEMNARRRELAKASGERRIEAAKAAFAGSIEVFEAMPHPMKHCADRGAKAAGYLTWMFKNAGMAGKIRACKLIEATLA